MFKRFLLLSMVALAALANGCGDTEHIQAVNYYTNVIGNGLSGQVGNVTVQTTLQAQVLGQTVSVVESTTVPTVVDQYRITGYGANGEAVYGPTLVAKAATTTLQNVPVEVRTLGIELLVDGLSIGGVTVPITVTNGQNTTVTNLTYVITAGGNGATGPAGPAGPTGPVGADGSTATAYGSFFASDSQVADGEFFSEIFFDIQFAALGIAPVADTFQANTLFEVATEGDYLITYNIRFGGTENGGGFAFQAWVPDGEGGFDDPLTGRFFFSLDGEDNGSQSYQIIVSLAAGQAFSLGSDGITGAIDEASFSAVRLGPSTNQTLPDPDNLNGGGQGPF